MSNLKINRICVVGAGNMGHQISLLCAIKGFKTYCTDIDENILNKAKEFSNTYLQSRIDKNRMTCEEVNKAKENIFFTTSLEEAAKDADLVIEAVTEKLKIKRNIFKKISEICKPDAILATNSSFIVSSKLADVVENPQRVCNMHFFNPALVMQAVEIVKGPHTSEATVKEAMDLCKKLGKKPVLVMKEIYGFIVNTILDAINRAAFKLADEGIATPEDIDTAVEGALNHPMGPFRLLDLTGIDLEYYVLEERYKETGKPEDMIPKVVEEKYKKGEFGVKTGKGYYNYNN